MANGDPLATIFDDVDDGLMSSADFAREKIRGGLGIFDLFQSLDGQTVASTGAWIDVRGWSRYTLNFRDLGSGTAKVFGAVGNSAPGISNDINYDLSGDITVTANADKIVTIEDRLDYIRVAKTAAGDTQPTNCVAKASH